MTEQTEHDEDNELMGCGCFSFSLGMAFMMLATFIGAHVQIVFR